MTTTSTDWRRIRAGLTTCRSSSSRATLPTNRAALTATNTAVPVRIAGRAELPVPWPPARAIQTAVPAARPMVWVPMLKVSL